MANSLDNAVENNTTNPFPLGSAAWLQWGFSELVLQLAHLLVTEYDLHWASNALHPGDNVFCDRYEDRMVMRKHRKSVYYVLVDVKQICKVLRECGIEKNRWMTFIHLVKDDTLDKIGIQDMIREQKKRVSVFISNDGLFFKTSYGHTQPAGTHGYGVFDPYSGKG